MQRCDLPEDAKSHWCETKVGILLELEPSRHEGDPCPELPDTFGNLAKLDELTREIHLTAADKAAPKGQLFGQADTEPAENENPLARPTRRGPRRRSRVRAAGGRSP